MKCLVYVSHNFTEWPIAVNKVCCTKLALSNVHDFGPDFVKLNDLLFFFGVYARIDVSTYQQFNEKILFSFFSVNPRCFLDIQKEKIHTLQVECKICK